jgi:DNA modification methylase
MNLENKYLLGDSRKLIKTLGSPSEPLFDLIISSPPYWDQKNYGNIDNQIGFKQSKKQYLLDLTQVFTDCYELTNHTGSMWIILDSFRRNGVVELLPFELSQIINSIGWKLRDVIIWDKNYGLPWHQKGQMRDIVEFILFFSKSEKYKFFIDRVKTIDEISKWWVDFPERFNPKGKTPTNIWRYQTRRRGTWPTPSVIKHLCPFPTGLAARIIELTTDKGDFVFDPFAGSGVALATAEAMGRRYLGVDLNPNYIDMFHGEVKHAIKIEWDEITNRRSGYESSKRNFEKSIMKLRILKYARNALKAFLEFVDKSERCKVKLGLILSEIPNEYDREKKIKGEIWIIGDIPKDDLEKALRLTNERLGKAPFSHFGVECSLKTSTLSLFIEHSGIDVDTTLYLYPKTKVRKYIKSDTVINWLNEVPSRLKPNGLILPMLSNIEIDVSWAVD